MLPARFELDVIVAVRCARQARLPVCARSGGHSYIGSSLCRGVVIDLQSFSGVRVLANTNAIVGPAATLGDALWGMWQKRRWFSGGVCPGVGVAGFLLGGGHGPYEGKLGLGCDSLISARVVDASATVRIASRTSHANLFWALCGGGGGHYGIVTQFVMRTASSLPFDRAVCFRFRWPHAVAGVVLSQWQNWDQVGGRVWFRMEVLPDASSGLVGHGACYDVSSTAQCIKLLKSGSFFKVAGRETLFLQRVTKAVDVAAFFGPDGGWGSYAAPNARSALLGKRFVDRGQGNQLTYQSSFLNIKLGNRSLTASIWQQYANQCVNPSGTSIPWTLCQLNLFNAAVSRKRYNAFPFRRADIIELYIIGGGSKNDGDLAYSKMKAFLKPFTVGGYVNYQEHQLAKNVYPKYYWGESLGKLIKVASTYNSGQVFSHPQPIPQSS